MGIKTLLRDEIQDELTKLGKTELGTEEYKISVDGVVKLIDKSIELGRFEEECQKEAINRNIDYELRSKQLHDENKDRRVKNIIAVAGIVIPAIITVWGTMKSFEFEEEGTITTIMGRGFINKLLLKK